MARVRLIHWKPEEAKHRAAGLEAAGYDVDFRPPNPPTLLRELRDDPPSAVVIDLTRLPSGGRDVGIAIRCQKRSRHTPLIFVGGRPDKVAQTERVLPDATYTTWKDIEEALERSVANPPLDPVVPQSRMSGYAGVPLPKKLGITDGSRVVLVGTPEGFVDSLGQLPGNATLSTDNSVHRDLTIWFVRSRHELHGGMSGMVEQVADGPLWIAWPKKSAKTGSGVTQQFVRASGLAAGLVDYKVCSIDNTWSGLLFRQRKARS